MDNFLKFDCLTAIYYVYDHFLKDFSLACEPGCYVCCTRNIVATSLEARYLLDSPFFNDLNLEQALLSAMKRPIYRPTLTTNHIADICLRQEDIPPDSSEHGQGTCPFLDQDGLCSVYERRPFACRAMSSTEVCRYGGEAAMEPFLVTVNLAVYQIIEHMDRDAVSGNLLDVLTDLADINAPGMENYLISNRVLPGFLVTPEEQGRFGAFMRRLASRQVGNTVLGAFLPLL